jgi:hypothetical protein
MEMIRKGLMVVAAACLSARGAAAQDELHLRQKLEGKRIVVQIDMPATSQGVDLFPGTSRPIDFARYSGRLKSNGVAIRAGETSMITKVHVKNDNIEVHLGGGGYGTLGDWFNSAITNNGADSGAAQQARIANERAQRAASGSRFNLRYPNGVVPEDLTVESVVKALGEHAVIPSLQQAAAVAAAPAPSAAAPAQTPAGAVQYVNVANTGASVAPVSSATPPSPAAPAPTAAPVQAAPVQASAPGPAAEPQPAAVPAMPKKGMSEEELERLTGKAASVKTAGQLTTKAYRWQDGTLEADFFNGVLVAYRMRSS